MLIGICGTICSGKTTILKYLEHKYVVVYIDKEIAKLHISKHAEINKIFGTNDKKIIMNKILGDEELNQALRDLFYIEIVSKLKELQVENKLVLVEDANMFANGLARYLDKTIYINTSETTCLENAAKRKTQTLEQTQMIIKKQVCENKYLENADYVIETIDNLNANVIKLKEIIKKIGK